MCSLSVGNVSMFVIRVLSCAMIAADSSIFLMASNICWWILVELMTEFCFSRRISRVNFVVKRLLMTVAMMACSIRRLQIVFLSLLVEIVGSLLLLPLTFLLFSSVSFSEICFCGLFFVKLDAVTLVTNAGYSLGWLWVLVFLAHGFRGNP